MCKMLPCFSCWIVSLREMNVSNVPKKGIFMSVVFLRRGSLCQSFFFFSFLCTTSPDEWSVRSCLNQENGILLHPQSWWVSHCTHPCRHSTAQIVEHLWDSSQAFHFNRCHRLFTFFLSLVYFFCTIQRATYFCGILCFLPLGIYFQDEIQNFLSLMFIPYAWKNAEESGRNLKRFSWRENWMLLWLEFIQ